MRERRVAYRVFGGESLSERDHLEDLGMDGRILLKLIFKDGMERHGLAQDSDKWWVFVNVVMNFQVSLNVENFFTS